MCVTVCLVCLCLFFWFKFLFFEWLLMAEGSFFGLLFFSFCRHVFPHMF